MDNKNYEDAMDHLLTTLSIFISVTNDAGIIPVTPLQYKVLSQSITKLQLFRESFLIKE